MGSEPAAGGSGRVAYRPPPGMPPTYPASHAHPDSHLLGKKGFGFLACCLAFTSLIVGRNAQQKKTFSQIRVLRGELKVKKATSLLVAQLTPSGVRCTI